jgi:predicted acylesterase/phospholipase RssA/CRP-like cAMP-binding protein
MSIGESLVDDLHSEARLVALNDGEVLMHEGDDAEEVFFLRSGRLTAWIRTVDSEIMIGTVEPGQVIGEVTVVVGGRRTATLRADGDTVVLGIARAEFEQWLNRHPEIADDVAEQARRRIDRSQVAAMLTEHMGATDPSVVGAILDRVEWRRLEPGATLFEQGDPSDAAHFIVSGRMLVVVHPDDGGQDMVRELGRGEVVGELGLIDSAPRSATVRAIRDTTLATFPTHVFEELANTYPALILHVARTLVARLRRPTLRLADRAASIAVAVMTGDDPATLVPVMLDEIARHGTVMHLSSERVDTLLNRTDISQVSDTNVAVPRLAEFLHEADLGHDHVVLQADEKLTSWTRRVLRQADRVVLMVSPRPDAAEWARIMDLVEVLDGVGHVVRVLAVVHPVGTDRPRGTATLMREVGATQVVHLRSGSVPDLRRLARLASGHGVGLVLSGGGARGFAHIGAYRALCEAGIPIDTVGGCSIGAPIAGAIALDIPVEELEDIVEGQFHRLLDYTVPIVSLIKGRRISRNIDANFGTWDIEDLWRPYYCVSTNLTTSQVEVHRTGDAAKFIRASVAIPGVLPPVPYQGDLLVDGGVLNNLPVTTMRMDGLIGTVIAVDVAPPRGPRARSEYGSSVSGWLALGAMIRRQGSVYPRLSTVLMRSMLTGAVHNQRDAMRAGVVDLLVTMDLPGVALLDFERVRAVAEAGYQSAKPAIDRWAAEQRWLGMAM